MYFSCLATCSPVIILSCKFSGIGLGCSPFNNASSFAFCNLLAASDSLINVLCCCITCSFCAIFSAAKFLTGSSLAFAARFSNLTKSFSSLSIYRLCCITPLSVGAGLSLKFCSASLISIFNSLTLFCAVCGFSS